MDPIQLGSHEKGALEGTVNFGNRSNELELSRDTLKVWDPLARAR